MKKLLILMAAVFVFALLSLSNANAQSAQGRWVPCPDPGGSGYTLECFVPSGTNQSITVNVNVNVAPERRRQRAYQDDGYYETQRPYKETHKSSYQDFGVSRNGYTWSRNPLSGVSVWYSRGWNKEEVRIEGDYYNERPRARVYSNDSQRRIYRGGRSYHDSTPGGFGTFFR